MVCVQDAVRGAFLRGYCSALMQFSDLRADGVRVVAGIGGRPVFDVFDEKCAELGVDPEHARELINLKREGFDA